MPRNNSNNESRRISGQRVSGRGAHAAHRGTCIPPPPSLSHPNTSTPLSAQQQIQGGGRGSHRRGGLSSSPAASAHATPQGASRDHPGSRAHPAAGPSTPSGRTPPSSRPQQRNPQHHKQHAGKRQYAGDEGVQGLPNPLVHVELEREGVWKVSAPAGQRFSKALLAGIEVWAARMMAGQEVHLAHSTYALAAQLATPPLPPPPPPPPPARNALLPAARDTMGAAFEECGGGGSSSSSSCAEDEGSWYSDSEGKSEWEEQEDGDDDEEAAAFGGGAREAGDGELGDDGSESDEGGEKDGHGGEGCDMEVGGLEREGAEAEGSNSGFSYSALCADDYGDGDSGGEVQARQRREVRAGTTAPSAATAAPATLTPTVQQGSAAGARGVRNSGSSGCSARGHAVLLAGSPPYCRSAPIPTAFSPAVPARGPPSQHASPSPLTSQPGLLHSPPMGNAVLQGVTTMHAACATVVTRGASIVRHSSAADGRVRISLHLEKQGLTDAEAQLLVAWYKERVADKIEIAKLWLFDNSIGDLGAAALAGLMHDRLQEVHLSHNTLTAAGAQSLLKALPCSRPTGRPLWLRMEWNLINLEELDVILEEQLESRGLQVEIPEVVKAHAGHTHQQNLKWKSIVVGRTFRPSAAKRGGVLSHVRLPWIQSQKQAPSESAVLMAVRSIYQSHSLGKLLKSGPQVPDTTDTPLMAFLSKDWPEPACSHRPLHSCTSERTVAVHPQGPPVAQQQQGMSSTQALPPASPALPQPAPAATAAPIRKPAAQQASDTRAQSGATQAQPQLSLPILEPSAPQLAPSLAKVALPPPPHSWQRPPASDGASTSPSQPPASGSAHSSSAARFGLGPLLLFPDTSALLSMLGANVELPRPPLTFSMLSALALDGRFGRALPPEEQVFVVVADSVMKQLDGLKTVPETRVAVRKFMSEQLEEMGPGGLDFLTVLGAHEGEGLALEAGQMGVAGSKSPLLSNRGAQVDVRIVEVALFFQNEILKASGDAGGASSGSGVCEGGAGGSAPAPSPLPVLLLTNDNSQLLVAKAHGLPAFRLSNVNAEQLQALQGAAQVSASTLRGVMGPWATMGLGSVAGTSLQQRFDESVAALQACRSGLHDALMALSRVHALAAGAGGGDGSGNSNSGGGLCKGGGTCMGVRAGREGEQGSTGTAHGATDRGATEGDATEGGVSEGAAARALQAIAALLEDSNGSKQQQQQQQQGGRGQGRGAAEPFLLSSLSSLLGALSTKLPELERAVQIQQQPSRVLRWTAAAASPQKD